MASEAGDDAAEGVIEGGGGVEPTPEPEPADDGAAPGPSPLESRVAELEAEREAMARRLDEAAAARDDAAGRAQASEAEREALLARWADEKAEGAILAALDGRVFIGDAPEVRERACRAFLREIKTDVEAARDASGSWRVVVKGGGDLAKFVSTVADQLDFLFAAPPDGGSGSRGGNVPAPTAHGAASLKGRARVRRFMAGDR